MIANRLDPGGRYIGLRKDSGLAVGWFRIGLRGPVELGDAGSESSLYNTLWLITAVVGVKIIM